MVRAVFLLCVVLPLVSGKELTLNGPQWVLRNKSTEDRIPAVVPGVVHLDLLRAGRIQEPYHRFGELDLQWVHTEPVWIYSRSFDASELQDFREVLLSSEGLDTIAEVKLNGVTVDHSENMWHRHEWPVRSLLRQGQNELEIMFLSPSTASLANRDAYPDDVKGMWITPFQWPSCGACEGKKVTEDCFLDEEWAKTCVNSRTTRNFLRKSSAHWGWDWGGGFLTSGIYRDLALKGFDTVIIIDAVVQTIPLGSGGSGNMDSAFRLVLDVFLRSVEDARVELSANLGLNDASNVTTFDVTPGASTTRISVEARNVDAASLWFPNGFGAPTLHNLTITAKCNGEISTWSKRVGLRRVELVEEPIEGQDGLSFYFRINGAPIFVKGANWVIQDQFEPRIQRSTFVELLQSAVEANFNMLRVWGGGTWERDDFYDIADELGIMVWEELKFGCSLYPRDRHFLANVRREVRDQIKRLSHHASIVVYSGNNENQGYLWGDNNYSPELIDYSLLYDSTVQDEIRSLDRSRPYWPASPSNGAKVDRPDIGVYVQRWNVAGGDSQSSLYGDSHIYPQYGSAEREATDCEDLRLFQSSRFVSEYGFIAMPTFAALVEVTDPGDWSMNSTQVFFRNRQDWPRGQNLLLHQLGLHFDEASASNSTEAFRDSIYLSQAVQAHCVQLSSEHFRLSRSGEAQTMGLLFWSLNNQWQGQSDASVDYTGRWKLLHHAVSRFFAPQLLVVHRSDPGAAGLTVGLVNDMPDAFSGKLTLELWGWNGDAPVKTLEHQNVSVAAFSSRNVTQCAVHDLLDGRDVRDAFLVARFRCDSNWEMVAHKFFTKLRSARLEDPAVSVEWAEQDEGKLTATLTAIRPCPWTFLDPGMLRGHFSDNGFLLVPGHPRTISFNAMGEPVSLRELQGHSTVRTPWDATMRGHAQII